MDYLAVFLVALGLAMDAFAVSICNGIAIKNIRLKHALAFGLMFGGLQMFMPIIGFFLGSTFSSYIENVDHWVAFGLLGAIGGKMLIDTFRKGDEEAVANEQGITLGKLFVLGIATSIDALAVGISIALTGWNIWTSALVIGAVAFALSFFGVLAGKQLGVRFEKNAGRVGGIILIGIGIKILLEHLLG
ncbi:MAG: manganese efflux pump MntP family protein [Coriobacteriales bacterium]|jgi:putative Mn2+ efflux pump MntP|nr:manganese efflux pump MntP family protein [Coriobacteriales bacterium]